MKLLFKFVLLILISGYQTFIYAQDIEADHNELRVLRKVFEDAINSNKLDNLKPYLADHFSYVTISDEEYKDFNNFKEQWQIGRDKLLKGGTYVMEIEPELSDLHGNIAIAKGDSKNLITTGSGDRYSYGSKWTAVCIKQDGKWKVLRVHSSINPFSNEILKGRVSKMLIQTASIAALAGLILGSLFTFIIRKRKIKPE